MKRRLLFVSAGVIALLLVISALGSQPAARADTSSTDWDVNMTDAAPTGADSTACPSNNDNNIDVNECPEIVTSMWMDTTDATSNEGFFDLAPQIWETGPPGDDLDDDGLAEPSTGVAQLSDLTIGTTVGRASFSVRNNLVMAIAQSASNIDDAKGDYDSTVTGQPVVCGNPSGSTWASTFDLWWADKSNTNLVPNANTVLNNYAFGDDCMAPPALYSETNVDTNLAVGHAAAYEQRGQGFQLPGSRAVGRVSLWLKASGAPTDDLTVEIQTDSSGVPSGTAVTNGTSNAVDGTSIGSTYGWVAFDFPTPPQLTAATQYHLVLKRSGPVDLANYYVWGADQSSPGYTDGAGSVYNTGSWEATSPATDHAFQASPDQYGTPDGVDCTPDGVLVTQATIGFPIANYVGRAYGIANIEIIPILLSVNVDFNYLIYNMVSVPEVQGYGAYLMLGYRTLAADPFAEGYSALSQSLIQCLPGTYAPVRMFGIAQDSDFTVPPNGTTDLVTPNEPHFKLVGDGANTYGFNLVKSTAEDWDGDTTADAFDRCRIDPNSGTADQDTDKDALTGLCENPLGMTTCVPGNQTLPDGNKVYWNCEGNNPEDKAPVGWNILWRGTPPVYEGWDSGQDVDGDGYLNEVDNCPIVPDRDLDNADLDNNPLTGIDYQLDTDGEGVGDVCEISLVGQLSGLQAGAELIPGDGQGYPGRAVGNMYQMSPGPGRFVDRDNICSDPFIPGTAEPAQDTGRWCAGFDLVGRPYGPIPSGIAALGRALADSNDDSMPDLLDLPQGGAIEWMDVDSDTDSDGHTDACEAFMGSDPLDDTSVPVYQSVTPPAGNCDNDGTPDATDSDPFTGLDPDADGDGCKRSQELPGAAGSEPGTTAATSNAGLVSFQDQAWYDFYDVPVPVKDDPTPNGVRNRSVNMQDVTVTLKYVGTSLNGPDNGKVDYDSDKGVDTTVPPDGVADIPPDGVPDGLAYDRSPGRPPNPPRDVGPPDGAVNMQDVTVLLGQVGLDCSAG